jgi:hypothetical protein
VQTSADNEVEYLFLSSYIRLGVHARRLCVRVLRDRYRVAEAHDEKQLLHHLAFEQYAILVETFEGFYCAIRDRERKPVLRTLRKEFNPGNLSGTLAQKEVADIVRELNVDLTGFTQSEQQQVSKIFEEIATWIKRITPHNRDFLHPWFKALKHKFLVYRDEQGSIRALFDSRVEKIMEKKYGGPIVGDSQPPADIDYLLDRAEWMESAIKALVAVRLLELQNRSQSSTR